MSAFYSEDLTFIHHTAFGAFSRDAAPGILARLYRSGIREGLIVDLGCGSGILARRLLDAGYDVLGVDCSPAMLELARLEAPGATFVASSLWDVDLPPCAALLCVGEGLSYFAPEDPLPQLPGFLRRAHEVLDPGGLLIFDVIYRSDGEVMRYENEVDRENWRLAVVVREDPGQGVLTRTIDVVRNVGGSERGTREIHRVRIFGLAALEELLRAVGFSVEIAHSYGRLPLPPRRAAFISRKPRGA